jgi:DNA-binding CsgD family transcriptional regulator/PAS domain-containing protein
MPDDLILRLKGEREAFLVRWEGNMERSGYLRSTTAKREDCVQSFLGFLTPLWTHIEAGGLGDFGQLLENRDGWADAVLGMARRHRQRGVTPGMFLGCFKTLVHSVEELLCCMEAAPDRILRAVLAVRRYADALDTLLEGEWSDLGQKNALAMLDASNRRLTLEKNKFENIFAATSDLVLVSDAQGTVLEANQAAREFLDPGRLAAAPVWEALDLDAAGMAAVLERYPPPGAHEISAYDGAFFLELRIVPLKAVSLASSGYLFLLANITAHVRQREMLGGMVEERTAELHEEKARLLEMNITLRNVMRSIEREREVFRQELGDTVRHGIIPALARLRKADAQTVRDGYADVLESQLLGLCAGTGRDEDARLLRLTPAEMRVCQFIQSGSRTKDIAEALNLSAETVQTHRKNIRRKLNLKGRDSNLFAYLRDKTPTSGH